jgi:2-hydroxy-6-oxonona-2,4-dienedioate hydrolase
MSNIGPLSEVCHVLAFDYLGTGLSDKPDHLFGINDYVKHVSDFMDAKHVERASLLGLSLGTWVAMGFYARYPDRVEKIILSSPVGMIPLPRGLSNEVRQQRLDAINNPTWETVRKIFDPMLLNDATKIDDIILIRQNIYRQPEMARSALNILPLFTDPDFSDQNLIPESVFSNCKTPVLLMNCPDGVDPTHESFLRAQALMPDAEVVDIHHSLHWPQFESPAEFNDAVIAFLGRK